MADNDLQNELTALKEDISRLRADVADLGSAIQDIASEKVSRAKSRLAEGAEEVSANVKERLEQARLKGREVLDGLEDQFTGHPMGSLITAFGAGFIIASLMNNHGGSKH